MSDFILYYDMLEAVANYSKFLGKRADEYADDLESKIIRGIGTVTGPPSGYLLSASDSIRDKINALKQKSKEFYQFAEQIMKLLEVAEQMDQEVADAITAQRGELEHHKSLGLEGWKAKVINLLVDLKNGSQILSTIADLLGGMAAIHESLEDSIKHWYETDGGKRKVKGELEKLKTYSNVAGVAATGIGVTSMFNGKEFDLFKNGPLSFSNLNNWKGNGKVELKNNIKKEYSKDSGTNGMGNTVAGFRQLEMQDNKSVSEAEVIFIAKMESVGMNFDEAYDLTVALRMNKGILTKKQYRDFGFADEFGMAYAELQYKLVQDGMTVEQIDYLNSSERLAQAVTMSIGMLVTAGINIRGSGSIANSVKKTSNITKGSGKSIKSGTGRGYKVDSTMFPDDEAAGVLRNGEYVKNPTAHNINEYITEGSNYLGNKNMNGQYMYVVDMDGNIVIGTRGGQRMPHPTLVGGKNPQVQAAGMVEIRGGKIYSINNASGHFKPSNDCLKIAEDAFGNLPQNIYSKDFKGFLPYGE
jgi:hypothetical protein